MTEPNEDTWERDDWDLGGAVELGREEVLRLARHLAEQHARLRDEELAEFTDLKRQLRERAAGAATAEAEQQEVDAERERLEQRARELDELKLDLAARAATSEAETEALAAEHERIEARGREVEERERRVAAQAEAKQTEA